MRSLCPFFLCFHDAFSLSSRITVVALGASRTPFEPRRSLCAISTYLAVGPSTIRGPPALSDLSMTTLRTHCKSVWFFSYIQENLLDMLNAEHYYSEKSFLSNCYLPHLNLREFGVITLLFISSRKMKVSQLCL